MAATDLEKRLAAVEKEIAEIRRAVPAPDPNHWVEKIAASFSSPREKAAFDEAMRLGRNWRRAQRPKNRKRRKPSEK